MNHCEAHNQTPSNDPADVCYGGLFTCSRCGQHVCSGYGGCDDLCDRCWSGNVAKGVLASIAEANPLTDGVPFDDLQSRNIINETLRNVVDGSTLLP